MNIRYNNFIESNWDRILYNAKVMNIAKDKKFLRKLIYSGKVSTAHTIVPKYDIGQIGNTTNKNRFREMYYRRLCDYIDTYQTKFGDDWDVHFQKDYEHTEDEEYTYRVHFFTIFDKVKVNNYNVNTSHIIRDLAIFNTIGMHKNGDFWIPRMQGLRLSFSQKEIRTGYVHSHLKVQSTLHRNGCDTLEQFCIGSSSDTSLLSGLLAEQFSKEQFELYLYSQDSIAECESNIGTPYIRFSKILESGKEKVSIHVEDTYHLYIREILFLGIPIDVNYYISDGKYCIKNNDVFHSFIKNLIIEKLLNDTWKMLLCKKGENGVYYSYASIEKSMGNSDSTISIREDSSSNSVPYIYYKGIKREFKVLKERIKDDNKLKIEEFIVYPNLLNYIHGELQHQLQKTAIAASNIRRHYSSNNVSSYLR